MEKIAFESKSRQLRKAESLKRMAGAIAHKFNNLLQGALSNLEISFIDLSKGDLKRKNLDGAMNAVIKAAEISSSMLVYLGQKTGEKEMSDLSDICRQSIPSITSDKPDPIDIRFNLMSSGPIVNANKSQIKQVLSILLTNSWEAISNGENVINLTVKTITPSEIPATNRFPLDWKPKGTLYACVEIADPGCGIQEKDIENLFDPFFSSKFTGRGLGLPAALGILKSHDGAITVESFVGTGSVFKFFLPISRETLVYQPQSPPEAPQVDRDEVVLLVEDEQMVRDMTKIMLEKSGFKVLEAYNGTEALRIFRRHKHEIRCAICDLNMPLMNGWETLAALRKITPEIPVILTSGYDQSEVLSVDQAERPQAFLGKPYDLKTLRETINRVLAKPNSAEERMAHK